MIQKISKTDQIRDRLLKEGNLSYLDKPEDIKAMNEMNEEMEEVRREYKVKERNSQVSAAEVLLTA